MGSFSIGTGIGFSQASVLRASGAIYPSCLKSAADFIGLLHLALIGEGDDGQFVHGARELVGIGQVEVLLGDAVEKLPELIKSGVRPDVIVLDPPRAGCGEPVLEAIAQSQPNRVVYVSCNPATLARDLAYLNDHGYQPVKVQPVDMFPRTHHVETVVLLIKQETSAAV